MALRVSGIELIVRNFTGFMAQTRRAAGAAVDLGLASDKTRTRLANLGAAAGTAATRTENALRKITVAGLNVANAFHQVEIAQRALANAIASGNADAIADATDRLAIATNNHVKAITNLTSATESLSISQVSELKALLAEEEAVNSAALSYDGWRETLVGLIPVLGDMISKGQISIAALGGMAKFLPAVGAAFAIGGAAVAGFGIALKAVTGVIGGVIGALKKLATGVINLVSGAFKGVAGAIEWATRPLRNFVGHVLEIASGIALWRFIRNVGEAFKQLTTQIGESVAEFQALEIRLDSLMARDYARGLGIPMAEAFERSAGAGEVLFDWMRKLAVTTPFRMTDISNLFTMSTALGLNVEKTKEMTIATTNFAAAMNIGDEALWRIIYNFGQMIQRGKLSGEEFRDLARNMVPIDDIMTRMAERAGMSKEAFREMAVEGGTPVMEFLDEFIKVASTDYPDAAKRMARTWQGVTSNIRDFLDTFVGIDLLKPVMDRFTGRLADMLDSAINNEALQKGFRILGQVLLRSFELITPFVDRLVGSFGALAKSLLGIREAGGKWATSLDEIRSRGDNIGNWVRQIGVAILTGTQIIGRLLDKISGKISEFSKETTVTFSGMATKAYSWGLGFIRSFSNGVAGALRLLTSVIGSITKILTYFFKPHSPPEIAPDIDTWGAETMNEWIKGFTNADFDLFDETADLVESYFRSLGDRVSKESLIPIILNARNAIAQAIAGASATGNASGAALNAITGLGIGDKNVGALFKTYFDTLMKVPTAEKAVAGATQKVEEAQRALDVARQRLDQFDDSLYGIADAEKAVEIAGQRVKDIQDEINLATAKYDGILANLRAQLEDVTDTFDQNNRLREIEQAIATGLLTTEEKQRLENEKRKMQIEREIKQVEKQRDAEVNTLESKLAAAKAEEVAAEKRLNSIKQEVEARKELLQLEVDRAEKELSAAKATEDRAKESVDLLESQAETIKKQIEALIEQNNLLNEQKRIIEEIEAEEGIVQPKQPFEPVDIPPTDIDAILAEIDKITKEAQTKADEFFIALSEIGTAWGDSGIETEWKNLTTTAGGLAKELEKLVGGEDGKSIFDRLGESWKNIRKELKIPEDEDFLTWLAKKIEDNVPKITTGIDALSRAADRMKTAVEVIGNIGKGFMNSFFVKDFVNISGDFLFGAINIFKASILMAQAFDKLAGNTESTLPKISEKFGLFVDAAVLTNPMLLTTWGILKGISTGIDAVGKLYLSFAEQFGKFVDSIERLKNGAELSEGLKRYAEGIAEALTRLLSIFVLPGLSAAGGPTGEIGTAISNLISGVILNMVNALGLDGRAQGGRVANNRSYIVGERGPEVFRPNVNGMIFPSLSAAAVGSPVGGNTNVDRSVTIEINPTYSKTQSEASIFYDVQAALATVYRR